MSERHVNINLSGLAALICIIGAIVIAAMGEDGWGWLLLIAVLMST